MDNRLAYRANKIFFYQSGPVVHIEVKVGDPVHQELVALLGIEDRTQSQKRRTNLLAKKVGFKSYYNSDFGRMMLQEDLSVITCDEHGYIKSST